MNECVRKSSYAEAMWNMAGPTHQGIVSLPTRFQLALELKMELETLIHIIWFWSRVESFGHSLSNQRLWYDSLDSTQTLPESQGPSGDVSVCLWWKWDFPWKMWHKYYLLDLNWIGFYIRKTFPIKTVLWESGFQRAYGLPTGPLEPSWGSMASCVLFRFKKGNNAEQWEVWAVESDLGWNLEPAASSLYDFGPIN